MTLWGRGKKKVWILAFLFEPEPGWKALVMFIWW